MPALSSTSANYRHNLPAQLTSFVGRVAALAEVRRLLETTRLLTLTGAGGVGKTRLALELTANLVERYPDGVWLVELGPLGDPALLPQTVAAALEVEEQPTRPLTHTLREYLESKRLLLVLDNCEHLIAACATLVETLLRGCPGVQVLATSREALGIAGEAAWRVPSLSVPGSLDSAPVAAPSQSEAVALFVERARAAQPGFELSPEQARAVGEICRRLDGVPLAIELAAARMELLSVEQIAARLDDRFRLLTGGSRTALPRQQTLRATIDWSYDLLNEDERALFRRLSVFAGGWTLEAAEGVCGREVLDLLGRLIRKSLVQVEHGSGGEPRYRLLETVRQYAQEKLLEAGEASEQRDRHRDWYVALVARPDDSPHLGARQPLALLDAEYDNLRAALAWSISDTADPAPALRLAAALDYFWYTRGRFGEGIDWLSRALAMTPPRQHETAAHARVLLVVGNLTRRQDLERAAAALEQAERLYRDLEIQLGVSLALDLLSEVLSTQGHDTEAVAAAEEAVDLARQAESPTHTVLALARLGRALSLAGQSARACEALEQADSMSSDLPAGIFPVPGSDGFMSIFLGRALHAEGEAARAVQAIERGIGQARAAGFKRAIAVGLQRLGLVLHAEGDDERVIPALEESLALSWEVRDLQPIADCLETIAGVAASRTEPATAARLLGAAAALRETTGAPVAPIDQPIVEANRQVARAALGDGAFNAALDEGRGAPLEQTVELAIATLRALRASVAAARSTLGDGAGPTLTPREREVAALVARGLTNRQIAEALVISERTASTHVTNILGKLGFATRAQVAAWAVEHGLPSRP